MSNTTTVKVAYVNEPKSPKGPGAIKTDTGEYIKVWPKAKDGGATLSQFEPGKTYLIEFDTETYEGKEKKVARKILSQSESTVVSSSNGHAPVVVSSDTNERILWQVCLKSAATILAGTGVPSADVIKFAQDLFAAVPTGVSVEQANSSNDGSDEVEI